jgi:DNA-binding NtrC family response regulator
MNTITKVLIIDDSQADIDILKIRLSKDKIKTDESKNLAEAFENIKKNIYDAIFLDLKLSETQGFETVEKTVNFLKASKKNLPIIILTGFEDYHIGKKALALGITDFLIKSEVSTKEVLRSLNFAVYDKKYKNEKK